MRPRTVSHPRVQAAARSPGASLQGSTCKKDPRQLNWAMVRFLSQFGFSNHNKMHCADLETEHRGRKILRKGR